MIRSVTVPVPKRFPGNRSVDRNLTVHPTLNSVRNASAPPRTVREGELGTPGPGVKFSVESASAAWARPGP
eukprot:699060-Hanusia_phi.AAC.1